MAPPDDGRVIVRSYRLPFNIERRLYRLDRWRIPAPFGVPLRGALYAGVIFALVLLAQRLPLLGDALTSLHPALRFVVIPVVVAGLLAQARPDGRTVHQAVGAWMRHLAGPRALVGFRRADPYGHLVIGAVQLVPDAAVPRYRPAVVYGPARVLLRYRARAHQGRRQLEVEQTGGPMWQGKVLTVPAGSEVRFR